MSNEYISPTLIYQELERMKFAQNLRKNPSDYSAYVNTRVDELSDEIFQRKRAAFQKAQIDLGRYMDMDHNANFYKERSGDVDRLTASIEENNKRIVQAVGADKDITKRQFEINEWYNYNKLETLFFLQVLFIAALSGAIVLYLQKTNVITAQFAGLLTGILVVIVAGVGLYRWSYTKQTRDPRLWHRRYFGDAAPPKPPVQCDKDGSLILDVNKVLPKAATQCADSAAAKFGKWQENLQKEMATFQETGKAPSATGGICNITWD